MLLAVLTASLVFSAMVAFAFVVSKRDMAMYYPGVTLDMTLDIKLTGLGPTGDIPKVGVETEVRMKDYSERR